MADYKRITYLDASMKIRRGIKVPFHEYQIITRASILRLLNWLNNNVLIDENIGFNLRSKLSDGIYFDQKWHQYLIESYCHWIDRVQYPIVRVVPRIQTKMINQTFIPHDSDDETASLDLRSATPTPLDMID